MHFAFPPPLWAVPVFAAAVVALAVWSYRRPLVPLTIPRRTVLIALRAVTLGVIITLVCRPTVLLPPSGGRDAVVPVLVDASRSMRVPDADGQPRIARASALVKSTLLPALSSRF